MCCGAKSKTTQARSVGQSMRVAPAQAEFNPPKPSSVQFEYVGKTRMTVISPNTGIRYHFESTGARLTVDPRDQVSMSPTCARYDSRGNSGNIWLAPI